MSLQVLNLHATLSASRANGPGLRYVIWFQGCTLACSGCFNPETHGPDKKTPVTVSELVATVRREEHRIEGITVSGGEPLQQPGGLLQLLRAVRRETDLTSVVFSGFDRLEIERIPLGKAILREIDVLVAGRYRREQHLGVGLLGSSNQKIHLLSQRYTLADVENTPEGEIHIEPEGRILLTGIGGISIRT
jgi:anaerobic ribonucleoside-triphosphate reductase activating protein